MAYTINSLDYDDTLYWFALPTGTCSTAAGTAAKTVTLGNFELNSHAQIRVKFTYANTASSPTLNVNSTGAQPIKRHGSSLTSGLYWKAGDVVDFYYDGTGWHMVGVTEVIGDLTASRALISDSSGQVAVSSVTSTELGYLDGVTSGIQTQFTNKMNKSSPTGTGTFSMNRKSSTTTGSYSVTTGNGGTASGSAAHACGYYTTASGNYSHAVGYYTTALLGQFATGHYNNTTTATAGTSSGSGSGTAFVIGNGTSSSSSNAFRVTYQGAIYANNSITTSGRDYAEYFEWEDLNPNSEDRRGYFVTLEGDKIRIAKPGDYILGIVSGQPSVIGNGDEDWQGRYILDDFGSRIIEEFEYDEEEPVEVVDEETGETKIEIKITKKIGTKYKENPDYDATLPYIQREDRPEWDAVGMLGVLSVRDDGTCKVNGFCKVAEGGIATASDDGYRVVKRVSDNVVKVIIK